MTMTRSAATRAGVRAADVPSVLAIVVTHNGRRWLKECLVSLNTQTYPNLDVLVVDDASRDSRLSPPLKRVTKRHLRRRRWAYLRAPRALGFGGAVNWALSRVRAKADLLLLMHDDAALDRTSLERMVARLLADDATALVGPKIVSWDDPRRLEEVGMAADRFGYPYKGLEEDEIDLGQHDVPADVFFVSSTCMLVRHDVFRDLRGFDSRMRAFSEDLDLCWRIHLRGRAVRVEPMARARHAIALAKGERLSPFTPPRYFIRRNRLRAVMKNASGIRLLALVPQFLLLALTEMIAFIVLREPREVFNIARGLAWNVGTLPQTIAERTRVQRTRRVSDRSLSRFTVKQGTRLRAYITHQAGRLEEAWATRADLIARGAKGARAFGARAWGWPALVAFALLIGLVLGFRHFLWAPPAAVGEILPYPDRVTGLWRAFLAPWRNVGLGEPGPGPPALALLGTVPFLTLGTGIAQKVLVLGLGVVGSIGAYKVVSDLVDRPARYAAAVVYALGGVGYAGLRGGRLGALVFGAVAPFVLLFLLRLTGWVRPPGWNTGRAIARLAFFGAVSAAFVPGSLLLYAFVTSILTLARAIVGQRGRDALRGLAWSGLGLLVAWALLLPWSSRWLAAGGPLASLLSSETKDSFAASFAGHGMASVVLGQTPDVPALFGLALPVFAVIALVLAEGQRRRLALALSAVVVATGWLIAATAAGVVPPVVASPTEAGVLAAVSFAALAGLAVGAFRLDLPRRGLGLFHAFAVGALAVAAFLVVAGALPALWNGRWTPGGEGGRENVEVTRQIASLLAAEVDELGAFRTLWIGERWDAPDPSVARPTSPYFITGPHGDLLSDLFERDAGPAGSDLELAIASIERGATDRGGSLLGAFNIRYVVLERDDGVGAWLSQRDLGVVRTGSEYLLLQNDNAVARAGVYRELPAPVAAIDRRDPTLSAGSSELRGEPAKQRGSHRYVAERASGPGVVFLAESHDDGWIASIDGGKLSRAPGGWGNAFAVGRDHSGKLSVSYPVTPGHVLWLLVVALAWIVVAGAAFSRRARVLRAPRPASLRS